MDLYVCCQFFLRAFNLLEMLKIVKISFTTVGYGDIYPTTFESQAISVFCMGCPILWTSFFLK